MDIAGLVLTSTIGVTLILSGIAKMFNLRASARVAQEVAILSKFLSKILGYSLPFIELTIGVGFLLGIFIKFMTICAILLTLAFIIANMKVILQKKDLACNCFGNVFMSRMGIGSLFHSIILSFLSIIILFTPVVNLNTLILYSSQSEIFLIFVNVFVFLLSTLSFRMIQV